MRRTLVIVALACLTSFAHAQSTAFTYQGNLNSAGSPANGVHDLRFKLFGAASDGAQVGSTVCVNNVQIVNGQFSATIDFGPQFANTSARHLEVDVRADSGLDCANTTGYTTLSPRQAITSVPRATAANTAFSLSSPDGTPQSSLLVDNDGRVGIGIAAPAAPLHVSAPNIGLTPGEGLRVQGFSSGVSNMAYVSFVNSAGAPIGYVGDGSTGDNTTFVGSYVGDICLVNTTERVLTATQAGRVGIGTTTPTAKLEVNGDIKVAPATRWKSVHGSAFIPQYLDHNSFGTQGGMNVIDSFGTGNSGTVMETGSSAPALYFAPLDLPDGAVVNEIILDARDTHAGVDASLSIGKINVNSGFCTEIATASTTGNSSVIQHRSAPANEAVNNSGNVYFLMARMASNAGSTHWLIAARVRYTVTSPLP